MTDHDVNRPTPATAPIHTSTTIIEKRSGGGGMVVIAIIGLALLLAVGYFLMVSDARENAQSEAVIGAAKSVGDAAGSVGDAAKDAADKLKDE